MRLRIVLEKSKGLHKNHLNNIYEMPIIASAKQPVAERPEPLDVKDPVKYRFSGYLLNNSLDENGNLKWIFQDKHQPSVYSRRALVNGISTMR